MIKDHSEKTVQFQREISHSQNKNILKEMVNFEGLGLTSEFVLAAARIHVRRGVNC